MKPQQYLHALRRRGWIIIVAVLVTSLSALGYSKLQTPIYRSSIEVSIQLARPDLGLTQSAKQLLSSYATVIWSEKTAQQVIDALNLYDSAADLKGRVKIANDDYRMVIKIDVDYTDGETANDIANTWAQQFITWRNEQNARQDKQDRVYAEVIDPATYRQLRPKTALNVGLGIILGGLLGAAIVFVQEWIEAGLVLSPHDLERELQITVIGVLPPTRS